MERREFMRAGVATVGMAAIPTTVSAKESTTTPMRFDPTLETVRDGMRFRKLGQTGELVSCIGVGGFHLGLPKTDTEAITIVRTALDAGINFLDNCWDYHDGTSELRMGKALEEGYRKKAFLMTKIDGRTKLTAAKQIDTCLLRLRTETIDLLQHHEMIRMEDADRVFDEGGAQEAVEAAKKAGKVRFVGFTGHKDPQVHLRVLEVARERGFRFDTVQLPLNVLDAHFRSFEKLVLPKLVEDKIGVLGMKPISNGLIADSKIATAIECLNYALCLPTSVVITGIETLERLQQALAVIKDFKPMTEDAIAALLNKTKKAALTGKHEKFKTSTKHDSTAAHPDWLG